MPDLAKIMAENQKGMMKVIVPMTKKSPAHRNIQYSDSETENISVAQTSTPVKTNTATIKTTPMNSRNMVTGVLNDSTTNNVHTENNPKIVLQHQDYCSRLKRKSATQNTSNAEGNHCFATRLRG